MSNARTGGFTRRAGIGRFALIAAALLLFAQTAAAAHYHEQPTSQRASLWAAVNADAGLCALCLLAFHFPVNPTATPAVVRPQIALNAATSPAPERAVAPDCTSAPTRAPPSAV
jgi:hypothetical protein